MASRNIKNIALPRATILKKEGVAILPLEKWEEIKEDLEMLRLKRLAKEIKKAREEQETISLEALLKEHNL